MSRALGNFGRQVNQLVSAGTNAPKRPTTVFLTHVKWVTGREQLRSYFGKFGQIEKISMFFDPETGLHRGFASVTYLDHQSAAMAIQQKPHIVDGDRVDVELFVPMKSKKKSVEFTI
ncbi:unnamed protein product, partial [Mesorhabditis belari]|uniref:RRM domain-containing protein n=1 Tax=Mesorhabditis belari TaxID=2138241 RepID=A0AAF3JC23_9BILA